MSVPVPTKEIADGANDAGRIFQSGGIDGLVLFLIFLLVLLLFLGMILTIFMALRALNKKTELSNAAFAAKDQIAADKDKLFAESMDRVAASLQTLAVSVAGDVQERAQTAATLRSMESTDAELKALLAKLR